MTRAEILASLNEVATLIWASNKTAQHLENVKTLEKLTDRELCRAIRDAIIAEEGAINQYETVADSTGNAKAKEVLQDIANEEKIHVGELQALLKTLLDDEQGFLDDGAKEVKGES
jgi:rubrerythrin